MVKRKHIIQIIYFFFLGTSLACTPIVRDFDLPDRGNEMAPSTLATDLKVDLTIDYIDEFGDPQTVLVKEGAQFTLVFKDGTNPDYSRTVSGGTEPYTCQWLDEVKILVHTCTPDYSGTFGGPGGPTGSVLYTLEDSEGIRAQMRITFEPVASE